MATVNEQVRDDSISRDLTNMRVSAAVQNEVDARLQKLTQDLTDVMRIINPMGKKGPARNRAQRRLILAGNDLINKAYAEIATINRKAMAKSALLESQAAVMDIEDALP